MKHCIVAPKRGTEMFNALKKQFGYEKAWRVYLQAVNPQFKEDYKKSLVLDKDGIPTLASLMKNPYMKSYMSDLDNIGIIESRFEELPDTEQNYYELLEKAAVFNRDDALGEKYIVYVQEKDGMLQIAATPRTQKSEEMFKYQYGEYLLKQRLASLFAPAGVTVNHLSDIEVKAGRTGKVNFNILREVATDFSGLIKVADNIEGARSTTEEFAHLLEGVFQKDVLMQRAMNAMSSEPALKEYLGDDFENYMTLYDNDLRRMAFEVVGKILKDNLLKLQVEEKTPYRNLFQRLIDKIRSFFKNYKLSDVQRAIAEADSAMNTFASRLLASSEITTDMIRSIATEGEFNNLSEKIERNIDILKEAAKTEAKRFEMSHEFSKEVAASRVSDINRYANENADTALGIFNYAALALQDLRSKDNELSAIDFCNSTKEEFKMLREAYAHIKMFKPFIVSLHKAAAEDEMDEYNMFNIKRTIKIGDTETEVTLKDILNEFSALMDKFEAKFNNLALPRFTEFMKPFFGKDGKVTINFGKMKGKEYTIEDILREANGDISFFDMWLDPLGESSNMMLQAFDHAMKSAKEKARMKTMDSVRTIQNLMNQCKADGITDFEWIFETLEDGTKTGYYIRPNNEGQYEQDRKEFYEYLDEKYGKHPTGEDARNKIAERNEWRDGTANKAGHAVLVDGYYVANPEIYRNERYYNMTDAQRKAYEGIINIKTMLETNYGRESMDSFRAIQIRKTKTQRLMDSMSSPSALWENIKGMTAEALFDQVDDEDVLGNRVKGGLADYDSTEYMRIPKLYITMLENPDELTTDVFKSLMCLAFSAHNYKEMTDIIDPLEIGRILMHDRSIFSVKKTRGGLPVVEHLKTLGVHGTNNLEETRSRILEKLDSAFESQAYMRYMKDAGAITLGDKQVSTNKLVALLMQGSSLAQLGFNYLANFANITTGVAMQNIEAVAGEFIKAKYLVQADKEYASMLPKFFSNFYNPVKNDKLSLFDNLFDIKQDYRGRLKDSSSRLLERIFGKGIAFIGQDAGDHWLYNRTAIAMCKDRQVKVPDGNGGYVVKSVWDALEERTVFGTEGAEDEVREMYIPEGTLNMDDSVFSVSELAKEILKVNQGLFGVYNDDDLVMANRVALGRLLLQYKKWMKPQFNKRFQAQQWNETLGMFEEGYYRTFFRLINELFRGQYQLSSIWNELSEHEKANLKRCLAEFVQLSGVFALAELHDWSDDKERPWAQKMAEYSAQRLLHELGTLAPTPMMISENMKTLESPIAAMSYLRSFSNLMMSVVDPRDYHDEIQSGAFKGHSTLYKNFMKAPLPGLAQYRMIERVVDDLDTSIAYYVRSK